MGEEFIAVIKLVSGEEILASVCVDETGEEPIIIAHTPVTMKMISNGMYVNRPHGSDGGYNTNTSMSTLLVLEMGE